MLNELVHIPADKAIIEGALSIPWQARGAVLFAHGSGSSRHSPRNNFVAKILNNSAIATLLIDLLTPEEDSDYAARFDIGLLPRRLTTVTAWLINSPQARNLSLGYSGASTGAAAPLKASAKEPAVRAVVSRGGRPDLAGTDLSEWRHRFYFWWAAVISA